MTALVAAWAVVGGAAMAAVVVIAYRAGEEIGYKRGSEEGYWRRRGEDGMTDQERLERIKELHQKATEAHDEGDPRMELHDIALFGFWASGHIDWLIRQAEQAHKDRELIIRLYRLMGMSAEKDFELWKHIEAYLGGREKARQALEQS